MENSTDVNFVYIRSQWYKAVLNLTFIAWFFLLDHWELTIGKKSHSEAFFTQVEHLLVNVLLSLSFGELPSSIPCHQVFREKEHDFPEVSSCSTTAEFRPSKHTVHKRQNFAQTTCLVAI